MKTSTCAMLGAYRPLPGLSRSGRSEWQRGRVGRDGSRDRHHRRRNSSIWMPSPSCKNGAQGAARTLTLSALARRVGCEVWVCSIFFSNGPFPLIFCKTVYSSPFYLSAFVLPRQYLVDSLVVVVTNGHAAAQHSDRTIPTIVSPAVSGFVLVFPAQ